MKNTILLTIFQAYLNTCICWEAESVVSARSEGASGGKLDTVGQNGVRTFSIGAAHAVSILVRDVEFISDPIAKGVAITVNKVAFWVSAS